MRLANIHVINHKSLRNVNLQLSEGTYTTLIGVNDAGKTTLLKSLQLFFDEKMSLALESESSQISSLSNSPIEDMEFDKILVEKRLPTFPYNKKAVYVFAEFIIERAYTVEEIDALGPSDHLQWVLKEKSIGDRLCVTKIVNSQGDEYWVSCEDAKAEDGTPRQLWNQTQAVLKELQQEHGVKDADIQNANKKGVPKKIERAYAIYSKLSLEEQWVKFDFKKDKEFFPKFRYLDWNISTEQIDDLVATALGPAISKSIVDLQTTVNKQRDDINDIANKTLAELYEKYSKHLPVTVTALRANIDISVAKRVTELFVEKSTSDNQVHISDQGEGVKRQIGLGLIRAIAEEGIESNSSETKYIWAFDEPETHLYPQAQRELASSLQQLSTTNFQVLVSTHSITFVDRSRLKDVHKVQLLDGYSHVFSTKDTEDALDVLGVRNSDFLFFDKFIAVEGPTEYFLLDHMYKLLYDSTLLEDGIRKINLGGKSNKQHYTAILKDILEDYQKTGDRIVYLLDKDTGSAQPDVFLIGEVADFEDSLSNIVWERLLADKCGITIDEAELNRMRGEIDATNKDKKLHVMLKSYVAALEQNSTRTAWLHSKGELLAADLRDVMVSAELVPECIKKAFEKVREDM